MAELGRGTLRNEENHQPATPIVWIEPQPAMVITRAKVIIIPINVRIIIISSFGLDLDIRHRLRRDQPRRRWALAGAKVVVQRCLSPVRPGC
ncbi:hypothetical protein LMG24076_01537 [Trinickia soli]|nr:hypothetical protein LMG24076_01537 [Trinickia soli]